jgi:hypothetical protein
MLAAADPAAGQFAEDLSEPRSESSRGAWGWLSGRRAALLPQLVIVKLSFLFGLRPLLGGLGRLLWGLLDTAGLAALAALLAALIFLFAHDSPRFHCKGKRQRKTSVDRFMLQMLFVN